MSSMSPTKNTNESERSYFTLHTSVTADALPFTVARYLHSVVQMFTLSDLPVKSTSLEFYPKLDCALRNRVPLILLAESNVSHPNFLFC